MKRVKQALVTGVALMLAGIPAASGQSTPATAVAGPVQPVAKTPPNILLVLMDDVGFGADSTFGGPVPTPNLDALAANGLRYNRFHTTAMCSPTRASLLTGRNHHRVEMASIVNLAFNAPGYTGVIPDSAATIADVLRTNGYATSWFGKNHLTPLWEQTAAGPFDRWPNGLGFDYFYGFMDGASDQLHPVLVEDLQTLDTPAQKDYVLDRDLADHAIGWIDRVRGAAPDKPFLMYFASGSAHEPHQAPAEWLARFRGKFNLGYDVERQRIFERQRKLGLIPKGTKLTPRPDILPAWNSLTPQEQAVSARMMEAFAAQRAYFDDQFGRLVTHLQETGQYDNTLIIFIDGDNGSSGEGGMKGSMLGLLNRPQETTAYMASKIDLIGGPLGASNYAAAWGWALDAPFPWFKQIASHLGATRAGMVVNWPGHIADPGSIRTQYGHVNDIAPTIYEAAGITPPQDFAGVRQLPIDGTSLLYTLADAGAASRHRVQYYEMLGNVGIYKDGWLAATNPPSLMFAPSNQPKTWQLFNLDRDFSQSTDLAAKFPERLKDLEAEWNHQQKLNGFTFRPDSIAARSNPSNRPDPFGGKRTIVLQPDEKPLLDQAFPALANRKWQLRAEVEIGSGRADGTLISQGGYPYGWGLYMIEGRPTFLYVNEPEAVLKLVAPKALGPGRHRIEIGMSPQDKAQGGPAEMWLAVDGGTRQSLLAERTVASFWGGNGIGIGREVGKPMLPSMGNPFAFTGQLQPIVLSLE